MKKNGKCKKSGKKKKQEHRKNTKKCECNKIRNEKVKWKSKKMIKSMIEI